MTHESLLDLFRNRPALAPELLREALHIELPAYREAQIKSADLTEVKPAEYRADLVILLVERAPVLGIVVEVQLDRNENKAYSWPAYLTQLRSRFRCPVTLLVLAPTPRVARWCARPIAIGHPGFSLTPLVLGGEIVPVVVDPERARQIPELAVLSALTYGQGGDEQALRVAMVAIGAAAELPEDLAMLYCDLILNSLDEATREALNSMMETQGHKFQSEFARKYYGKGREEGREAGREEGREAGREEGMACGEAKAVLAFLQARGLPVSEAQRDQILACRDLARLDRWIALAATACSTGELLKA